MPRASIRRAAPRGQSRRPHRQDGPSAESCSRSSASRTSRRLSRAGTCLRDRIEKRGGARKEDRDASREVARLSGARRCCAREQSSPGCSSTRRSTSRGAHARVHRVSADEAVQGIARAKLMKHGTKIRRVSRARREVYWLCRHAHERVAVLPDWTSRRRLGDDGDRAQRDDGRETRGEISVQEEIATVGGRWRVHDVLLARRDARCGLPGKTTLEVSPQAALTGPKVVAIMGTRTEVVVALEDALAEHGFTFRHYQNRERIDLTRRPEAKIGREPTTIPSTRSR